MTFDDDQKMRELVDRLVAMSPEPPPYPDEVTMAMPTTRTRRSPIIVFAGTAAVVLLVAAIPLLLSNDTPPVGGTTPPPVTDTTLTDQTTVTEAPPLTAQQAVVYLVQNPDNSRGNPALVPFLTSVTGTEDDSEILLALQLLTDPDLTPPPGFDNMIPAGVEVLDVSVDGEVISVDMNDEFLSGAGGTLADFTMVNQMVFTATQSNPSATVRFTVNGEPVVAFGGNGLDLTAVDRDDEDFLNNLNSVIVTDIETTPDGVIVSGLARVFEATVNFDVVDDNGNVVEEPAFAPASEGAPEWGEYTFEVTHDFEQTPGSIRVFWGSPEDGSPTDVVTIPVRAAGDEVWDLRP